MQTKLIAALGVYLFSSAAPAAVLELHPVDDTQVVLGVGFYADEPDKNYGTSSAAAASTSRIAFDWDRVLRTLLKFDLSGLSDAVTIESATLVLTPAGYTSNPLVVQLNHLGDDGWVEGEVTWNTAPSLGVATPLATRQWSPGDPINWAHWSLPAAGVWDWAPDIGDGYVSYMLRVADDLTTTPNRGVSWNTKEAGLASAPVLLIEYTPVPLPAAFPLLALGLGIFLRLRDAC